MAVEEKWITDKIAQDTYDRWPGNYNNEIRLLKSEIARLGKDHSGALTILYKHLEKLEDLKGVYREADTIEKRQFISVGFDKNLYYQNGIYRTPTMMVILSRNSLEMKDKGFLIYEKNGDFHTKIPAGGAGGSFF